MKKLFYELGMFDRCMWILKVGNHILIKRMQAEFYFGIANCLFLEPIVSTYFFFIKAMKIKCKSGIRYEPIYTKERKEAKGYPIVTKTKSSLPW